MGKTAVYSTRKTFVRLIKHSKAYVFHYLCLLLIISCLAFVNIGYLESIRRIISGATTKSLDSVYMGAILAIGATIVQVLLGLLQGRVMIRVKNKSVTAMQHSVLNQLHGKQHESLEGYHSSDLVGRLLHSVDKAQSGVNEKLLVFFQNGLQVILSLAYFSWLNLPLTIGLIGFTLLYPIITYPISRVLRKNYDHQGDEIAQRDVVLQEAVQGVEAVRTYQLQNYFQNVLEGRLNKVLMRTLKISLYERSVDSLNRFATFGGMIFTLGFGGYQVIQGELLAGTLATFVVTSGQLINPLLSISSLWTEMIQSITQAQRVFTISDLPEENNKTFTGNSSSVSQTSHSIMFSNVGYRYSNGNNGVKNISFQIEAGQMLAIVGPSGAGKSTLMKLMLRLYTPSEGVIKSGQVSITDMNLNEWRSSLGYVSQDAIVFSGSVRENICFGLSDISMTEVENAAKLAHLHDRISMLPQGYETCIGERGVQLSGGEVQRLALARVYLRKSPILLLDEPTSALDLENGIKFRESLDRLVQSCTTIVIAHNLDTIRSANKIVYMNEGTIEEMGSHEELMNNKGKYYQLIQSKVL
ncbi:MULTISPECIES: ABC transporter ATP-binding protein [unclassified Paenibacillus]|uniref:ABC transporter ATP-binding protein n=1 Tax=unclassified Paenibacillus TaxID=185978 RepID=UPI0009A75444|nr:MULTISPECIES: ABC transporter ATP-binding protein [unclassified Paenibacillus]SLK20236.1 ATP-binding cassette, subfamily B, MsbA [Paenibacillus sp. RU5A]SOC76115.1 ATP-binding cassette, subfamily B, MsbA [Paenibacillus sp. RU26A]SOC77805.1 ATP-binding cassette, subfamily B, MsbA [Paenibacillus sp. RU5M]